MADRRRAGVSGQAREAADGIDCRLGLSVGIALEFL
jgi:hypothetical protein